MFALLIQLIITAGSFHLKREQQVANPFVATANKTLPIPDACWKVQIDSKVLCTPEKQNSSGNPLI